MQRILIKIFLFSTALLAFEPVTAQQTIKPKFKKLTYAFYSIDKSGTQEIVKFDSYYEINENGQVHYKEDYGDGISDTTYQMADTLIYKLNKVFDGSKKLKAYMTSDKLAPGDHFAGPLGFLSLVYANNTSENLIIVLPFMDQGFLDLLDPVLSVSVHKRNSKISMKNVPLENQIKKYYDSCKYLPKIEQPPPIGELIKGQ